MPSTVPVRAFFPRAIFVQDGPCPVSLAVHERSGFLRPVLVPDFPCTVQAVVRIRALGDRAVSVFEHPSALSVAIYIGTSSHVVWINVCDSPPTVSFPVQVHTLGHGTVDVAGGPPSIKHTIQEYALANGAIGIAYGYRAICDAVDVSAFHHGTARLALNPATLLPAIFKAPSVNLLLPVGLCPCECAGAIGNASRATAGPGHGVAGVMVSVKHVTFGLAIERHPATGAGRFVRAHVVCADSRRQAGGRAARDRRPPRAWDVPCRPNESVGLQTVQVPRDLLPARLLPPADRRARPRPEQPIRHARVESLAPQAALNLSPGRPIETSLASTVCGSSSIVEVT